MPEHIFVGVYIPNNIRLPAIHQRQVNCLDIPITRPFGENKSYAFPLVWPPPKKLPTHVHDSMN